MAPDGQAAGEPPLGATRRWAITVTVMLVSVLQILDTSVTNVALPHIQGALSAGLDEVSWVHHLVPGGQCHRAARHGVAHRAARTAALLPDLHRAVHRQLLSLRRRALHRVPDRHAHPPGSGGRADHPRRAGGAVGDLSAPPARHGHGGVGARDRARPDVRADGGRLDRRQLVVALDLLHQPAHRRARLLHGEHRSVRLPHTKPPGRVDLSGLLLMVLGFGCLQLVLDRGERADWFDSTAITGDGGGGDDGARRPS